MTQTTTALLFPEPAPGCPAGIDWCDGTAHIGGGDYHTSGADYVTAPLNSRDSINLLVSVMLDRQIGDRPEVHLLLSQIVVDDPIRMTPETAREFAAMLLSAANDAEATR
jgi:hypothetical protein